MTVNQKRFFAIAYALVGIVFVTGLAGLLINASDDSPSLRPHPINGARNGNANGGVVQPSTGPPSLTVRTDPPDIPVAIYIDNRFSPGTVFDGVAPGVRLLTVEADGYETATQQIEMPDGPLSVTVTLTPVQTASLEIRSVPDQAEVYVDGARYARTNTTIEGLRPGAHVVRLVKTDYFDHQEEVTLEPNTVTTLDVMLQSRAVAFLEAQIRENPRVLVNYIELIHHYVIEKNYSRFSYWYGRALICLEQGPSDDRAEIRRLDQEIDKIRQGRQYYGFTPEEIQRFMEAINNAYVVAAHEAPDNPKFRGHLLNAHVEQGRIAEAQAVLEEGLKVFPDDRSWFLAPHGYRNWRQTAQLMQKQLDDHPNDFTALYRLAALYLYAAEVDSAIGTYEKLVELAKDTDVKVSGLNKLGELYERANQHEKAYETYKKAMEQTQDNLLKARQAFTIGVLLQDRLERLGDAIAYYNQAIGLQPDVEMACRWRIELAQLFVSQNNSDQARSLLETVLEESKEERTRQRARRLMDSLKGD